jgi:pyrimidine deaminase RibD-like protein
MFIERHIDTVVTREPCDRHGKETGFPCWFLTGAGGNRVLFGVCNSRAKKAGFVGKISPTARQMHRYKKK